MKKSDIVLTRSQVWQALETRYPKREYALLAQVRNATGNSTRSVRTADALALSLWPSRGIELFGFELKSYRGDWTREKDNPAKADAIAQYCDYWWLVVSDANIAPLNEIPKAWGLLAPDNKSTDEAPRLTVLKQPALLKAKPLAREFIASILRNASDATVPAMSVEAKIEAAHAEGIKVGERRSADIKELERLRALEQEVQKFKEASGLTLNVLYGRADAKKIGEAIKSITQSGDSLRWQLEGMERLSTTAERLAKDTREQMTVIRDAAAAFMADRAEA